MLGPTLSLLLTLVSAIPGATAAIDAACAAPKVNATQKRATTDRARIFVEVSGAILPKPREGQWRELATQTELRALSEGARPPNTEAIVRPARDGTLVSMYFQDSSMTWAHVVDYCFRAAGPLARLSGTFNSFTAAGAGPGIRRRRTVYYDARGAELRSKTSAFDLDTERPLPHPTFLDEPDPLYPSVRALPFSSDLLPPVAAVDPDPEGFAAAVRARLPAVKTCYQRAAKRAPGLAGKAIGRWTVELTGRVSAFAWESDEIGSPTFSACAQKVIEAWRFPTRDSPKSVSFPFVFGGPGANVSLAP